MHMLKLSFLLALMISVCAHGQTADKRNAKKTTPPSATEPTAPPSAAKLAPGEVIDFKIDQGAAPAPSRPIFKVEDSAKAAPAIPVEAPEDAPFRTYVGYPKNRFSAIVIPKNTSSTWSLNGEDFSFRSPSVAYGAGYEFAMNPRIAFEVEYLRYALKIDDSKGTYNIHSSTATYDNYAARMRYCLYGASSFFQQLCPGLEIANKAFPILAFSSGSDLSLDKVQDIVIGLSFTYQAPISDRANMRAKAVYAMGTGTGNSGSLTPKNDAALGLQVGARFELAPHHDLGADFDYENRTTNVKDKHANVNDTWSTKSMDLGLRLIYTYTL